MAEGTYLYVNKTLIEALALLALASTRSGRWFGIDALLTCIPLMRRGKMQGTVWIEIPIHELASSPSPTYTALQAR